MFLLVVIIVVILVVILSFLLLLVIVFVAVTVVVLLVVIVSVVVVTNLLLNQAWIWAYFPHFSNNAVINPASRSDKRAVVRDGAPPVAVPGSKSVVRLRKIRRILDVVSFDEV